MRSSTVGGTCPSEAPDHLLRCQRIIAIPLRRHPRTTVGYLAKENLARILEQPDVRTSAGRRYAVLLSVLYDTGARVQELIDMSAGDVRLAPTAQVRLFGKGRKMRAVPLMDATARLFRDHLRESGLDRPERFELPLSRPAARAAVPMGRDVILDKHVRAARNAHRAST